MKTLTVRVSLLSVCFAIFAAHGNPAAARENRRNIHRRACLPVCSSFCTQSQTVVDVATASPVPVDDAELRAKLIERRDTLKELVRIHARRAQTGGESTSMSNQAYIDLLEAELPLTNSHAERIILYEKSLAARTEIERVTQAMLDAAAGTPADHLRAKADRIQAEIDLHNARKMK